MDPASETEENFLISIVIATFNAETSLETCLESIRRQSASIEIVIVDGGSTDATLTILNNYNYPGLRWISEPDEGIYDALNKGTRLASGRWFYFMGADDFLLPGFSAMASQLISDSTIYYGVPEAYYLPGKRPDYELLTGKFSRYRLAKYPLNHQAILYPAVVFRKYQYQTQYHIFADYALNMQLWGDARFEKKFLPISMVKYNMTGFSSTGKDLRFESDKPGLIRKYLGSFVYWRWRWKVYKKKLRGETF